MGLIKILKRMWREQGDDWATVQILCSAISQVSACVGGGGAGDMHDKRAIKTQVDPGQHRLPEQ